jgi:hypothetical protein
MLEVEGNLHVLAGGLRVKARVQHPQVKPRKDREGWPWVFRYWFDEVQPDGSVKTLRKYQAVGPSKGADAITKKAAEIERDKVLAKLNAPTVEVAVQQVASTGVALFGEVAGMYEEGYLARQDQIARPTREKETFYLQNAPPILLSRHRPQACCNKRTSRGQSCIRNNSQSGCGDESAGILQASGDTEAKISRR